jgi:hypothetical protein
MILKSDALLRFSPFSSSYWLPGTGCELGFKAQDGSSGSSATYMDVAGDHPSSEHSFDAVTLRAERLGCDGDAGSMSVFSTCCVCTIAEDADACAAEDSKSMTLGSENAFSLSFVATIDVDFSVASTKRSLDDWAISLLVNNTGGVYGTGQTITAITVASSISARNRVRRYEDIQYTATVASGGSFSAADTSRAVAHFNNILEAGNMTQSSKTIGDAILTLMAAERVVVVTKVETNVEPCNSAGDLPDPCGECGGNGESCSGCDGVAHSGLEEDVCGVCNGLNADMDCHGVCFGTASVDSCGECSSGTTGFATDYTLDCAGVCHGDAALDYCGECSGGTTNVAANTTLDCNFVCSGSFVIDPHCGVCSNPKIDIEYRDCKGICFGESDCYDAPVYKGCDVNPNTPDCYNVTGISPNSAGFNGGTAVSVSGIGFDGRIGMSCEFLRRQSQLGREVRHLVPLTSTGNNNGRGEPIWVCTSPAFSDGEVEGGSHWVFEFSIVDDSNDATDPISFIVYEESYPEVRSIFPTQGILTEFTDVTISGLGFSGLPDCACMIAATGIVVRGTVHDDNTMSCTLPPASDSSNSIVTVLLNGVNRADEPELNLGFKYVAPVAQIQALRFSQSLQTLTVDWNVPLAVATDNDCKRYFNSDTILQYINGASECVQRSSRRIEIMLVPGAHVVPGAHFETADKVAQLRHAVDLTVVGSTGFLVEQIHDDWTKVSADIAGPLLIPPCGNLHLDGFFSVGNGYRSFKYVWSIFMTDEDITSNREAAKGFREIKAVFAKSSTDPQTVTLDANIFFFDVKYTILLKVENFLGVTDTTAVTLEKVRSVRTPKISISGPTVQSVFFNEDLVIHSEVDVFDCHSRVDKIDYSWGIDKCLNEACTSVAPAGVSLSATTPSIRLPPGQLKVESRYRFRLTASTRGFSAVANAEVLFDVLQPPLSCEIRGGGVVTSINASGPLAFSIHGIGTTGDQVSNTRWECIKAPGGPCFAVGTYKPLTFSRGITLSIPPNSLQAGTYTFTAQVDGYSATGVTSCAAEVELVAASSQSPAISTFAEVTALENVNPSETITIGANIYWPSFATAKNVEWESVDVYGVASQSIKLDDSTVFLTSNEFLDTGIVRQKFFEHDSAPQNTVVLMLKPGALSGGLEYRFRLRAYRPDNHAYWMEPATAEIVLKTITPPKGGLDIGGNTPSKVVEGRTLSATNWIDTDGSKTVEHYFVHQLNSSGNHDSELILNQPSLATSITAMLGRADPRNMPSIALHSVSRAVSMSTASQRQNRERRNPSYEYDINSGSGAKVTVITAAALETAELRSLSATTLMNMKIQIEQWSNNLQDWSSALGIATAGIVQLNRGPVEELSDFARGGQYAAAAASFKEFVADFLQLIDLSGKKTTVDTSQLVRALQVARELALDGPTGGLTISASATLAAAVLKLARGLAARGAHMLTLVGYEAALMGTGKLHSQTPELIELIASGPGLYSGAIIMGDSEAVAIGPFADENGRIDPSVLECTLSGPDSEDTAAIAAYSETTPNTLAKAAIFTVQSRVFGFIPKNANVELEVEWKGADIDAPWCIVRHTHSGDWVVVERAQNKNTISDKQTVSCAITPEITDIGNWLYVALAKKIATSTTTATTTTTEESQTTATQTETVVTSTSGTTLKKITITKAPTKQTVAADDIVNTGPESAVVADSNDSMAGTDAAIAGVLGVVVLLILIGIGVFYKISHHPEEEKALQIGRSIRRSSKVGPQDAAVAQAEMEEARIIERLAAKGGFLLNPSGGSTWHEKVGNTGRRVSQTAFLPSQHATEPPARPPLLPPLNPQHTSGGKWSLDAKQAEELASQFATPKQVSVRTVPREPSARLSTPAGSIPMPSARSADSGGSVASPKNHRSTHGTPRVPLPRTPSSISQIGPSVPLGKQTELNYDDEFEALPRLGAPQDVSSV